MPSFHVKIVAPTGTLFDGTAESLVAPGEMGSFGVLANHAPMIAALRAGVLKIDAGGAITWLTVGPGILEVSEGNVSVLADRAEVAKNEEDAHARLVVEHH